MYVTSVYPSFNYGYFYSVKFTFSRLSKAVENRRKAQWVLGLMLQAWEPRGGDLEDFYPDVCVEGLEKDPF